MKSGEDLGITITTADSLKWRARLVEVAGLVPELLELNIAVVYRHTAPLTDRRYTKCFYLAMPQREPAQKIWHDVVYR